MRKEFKDLAGDLAAYIKDLDEDTYMSVTSKTARQQVSKSAGQLGGETARQHDNIAVHESQKDEMAALAAEIGKCRKCQLGNSRINAVVGVGDPRARVVFVGEGPGFQEDHKGEPFVGRSGQLLDKILETVLGLKREDVYIANIVKCHPMINPETPEAHGNDRPPTIEEISACRPYLDRQLMLIKPKCIVTLGSVATKVLLGVTQGISFVRGKWYDYPVELFGPGHPIKVLPTYHPAALLRNPNLKRDTWEDMKMLKAFIEKDQ